MKKIQTNLEFAHQPYLFEDKLFYVASRGKVRPLFEANGILDEEPHVRGNTLNWQLWCGDFDKSSLSLTNEVHIKTGFYAICSPVGYRDANGIAISFIGGTRTDAMRYGLYVGRLNLEACRLDEITSQSTRGSFYGYTLPQYSTHSTRRNRGKFIINVAYNDIEVATQLDVIYRIVPSPDNPWQILATGMKDGQEQTHLYEFKSGSLDYLGEIKVEGQSIYKSVISNKLCIYAVKLGEDEFEMRQLYAAPYEIVL